MRSFVVPLLFLFLLLLLLLFTSGCEVTKTDTAAADKPAHHTQTGFKNLYIEDSKKTFFDFLKMRFWDKQDPWARHEDFADKIEVVPVDLPGVSNPPTALQVTWLGHSMFLLQKNGINLLTDPIFSDYASPLSFVGPKRFTAHPVDYAKLPDIDFVIISHNHYDHLDAATIQSLIGDTQFIVPLKLKAWFVELGVAAENVIELDWWQHQAFANISFEALPSQHWSARGLFDRRETLWASWSIRFDDQIIWFAGDTGYNNVQFKQIGAHLGQVDVALIPIGAYAPRWFMRYYHVNPEEAVAIHNDVNAKLSLGMHWGTFPLTAEDPTEPPVRLAQALQQQQIAASAFQTMAIGETKSIDIH